MTAADTLTHAATTFLVTGDPQVTDARNLELLGTDVPRLAVLLAEADFLVVLGDLTKSGTPAQLGGYRAVMAPLWDRTYHVFGGHDGLAQQPARYSTDEFEQLIGPAWRSWNAGAVHFLAITTERLFLTEQQYDEQMAWLAADLERVPAGRPIVVFSHMPPDDAQHRLLRRHHRVLCNFLGHWHTPHRGEYGGVEIDLEGARAAGAYQPGEWTNVAIKVNGADTRHWRIYLNGADVTDTRWAGALPGHETVGGFRSAAEAWPHHELPVDLVLGALPRAEHGLTHYFNGMLDSFRISGGQVPPADLRSVP